MTEENIKHRFSKNWRQKIVVQSRNVCCIAFYIIRLGLLCTHYGLNCVRGCLTCKTYMKNQK